MTEYWKSAPKYWCKFCKVYVRDTKFERTQHEATARHQGSIQKSLRDLHRGKEREERDQQRAKDEVARLNGTYGGGEPRTSSVSSAPKAGISTAAPTSKPSQRHATAADRNRQMEQLISMGVAIPEEYREKMTVPGQWQTVSVKQVATEKEKDEETKDSNEVPEFRRRKREETKEEEDEEESFAPKKQKKGWTTQFKSSKGDINFDEMLGAVTVKKDEAIEVKEEDGEDETVPEDNDPDTTAENQPLPEEEEAPAPIIFKKRKKAAKEKLEA